MNLTAFKLAEWQYKKGIAQLINNHSALITIKFGHRISEAIIQNRKLQIRKVGFWRPQIIITEVGTILLKQQQIGIWGYCHEVRIDNRSYSVKSKASFHYCVCYRNAQGKEVVSYHLNSWKWKAKAEFRIDETAAPANDILLLLTVGYLTLRKLKQDSDGAVAVIAATG